MPWLVWVDWLEHRPYTERLWIWLLLEVYMEGNQSMFPQNVYLSVSSASPITPAVLAWKWDCHLPLTAQGRRPTLTWKCLALMNDQTPYGEGGLVRCLTFRATSARMWCGSCEYRSPRPTMASSSPRSAACSKWKMADSRSQSSSFSQKRPPSWYRTMARWTCHIDGGLAGQSGRQWPHPWAQPAYKGSSERRR